MTSFLFRTLWDWLNSAYSATFGDGSLGFLFWFVLLHVLLGVATLALGDRTICDMLRPLRKIFEFDTDALLDSVLEITLAIPRAIFYYASLYLRAYILLIRMLMMAWLAMIPALLTLLILSLVFGLAFGFDTPVDEHRNAANLLVWTVYPAWAYWYWRVDGKRLLSNLRYAFSCVF